MKIREDAVCKGQREGTSKDNMLQRRWQPEDRVEQGVYLRGSSNLSKGAH